MQRPRYLAIFLLSATLAFFNTASAAEWMTERPKLTEVERLGEPVEKSPSTAQSLGYGLTLYEYFQGNNFEALTEYAVAEQRNSLTGHGSYPQLMQGGISLDFGMDRQAQTVFNELLDGAYSDGERAQAWFYLGKIAYERRNFQRSVEALSEVNPYLPDRLKDEYRGLVSQLSVHTGDIERAEQARDRISRDSPYKAYANFNIGAAYQRYYAKSQEGITPAATDSLVTATDSNKPVDRNSGWYAASKALDDAADSALGLQWDEAEGVHPDEFPALADRALLASAYALMQGDQYDEAIERFRKVRIEGPYSGQAMLGYGWAEASKENYAAALTPWGHLVKLSLISPAVQEAYVAIPFAYQKLGADSQALQAFEFALQNYQAEVQRIDKAIQTLGEASIKDLFIVEQAEDYANWIAAREATKLNPQSPYLSELLAGHDFHTILSDIRDLYAVEANLESWQKRMGFVESVLDSRKNAYGSLRALGKGQLEQRIGVIDNKRQAGGDAMLDRSIEIVRNRKERLDSLLREEPNWTAQRDRFDVTRQRLEDGVKENQQALELAQKYLSKLAIAKLERHKQVINSYLNQSQLAITRLYDQGLSGSAEEGSSEIEESPNQFESREGSDRDFGTDSDMEWWGPGQ